MATRQAHLDWAASHKHRIAMAGPVFLDDGTTMAGSTFVISFDSLEDARAWAAEDPYAKVGLFDRVEVIPFRWTLGGGKPADA